MVILYFLAVRFKWCAIFCNSSSDVAIKIWSYIYSFFFFNRYCNPCGFWPPQLSLSILSRKGFTECRCQRHVKPPTWRTSDYNVPTLATGSPQRLNDASEPQQRKVELWARNCREFCRKWRLSRHFWVLLHAVNLRHETDGFTSPPKEGALRIFFARSYIYIYIYIYIYEFPFY